MKKILVADDTFHIRETVQELLTKEGYFVKTASSTDETWTMIQAWNPDLLLLDILIPGMDLTRFVEKINTVEGLKVLYLSVIKKFMAKRKQLLDLSDAIKGYIHKPFSVEDLLRKVEAVLSEE
ncbi:MAG: response regulator [Candidatus Korarchaeota archaeon]|nr:response regulator [Candidatus Korarchaeota archaeon]NIU82546.1 response regulator [Candidatus Thorarchaeota archaeon]NIW13034.1 response regulator [Candidatus Thorarchaeota archaeon]NIW51209.1 response regulator [Candidatus Korarchaeota archaeon]